MLPENGVYIGLRHTTRAYLVTSASILKTTLLATGRLTTALVITALPVNASALAETRADGPFALRPASITPVDAPPLMIPAGVSLTRLATLDAPRMLHITSQGEVLIGSRADNVYRGQLARDGSLDAMETLVELAGYPHSVVVRESHLYVATTDALLMADYEPRQALSRDDFQHVLAIPGGGGHNSRTLSLGPDGALYLALGIQGNCSDQYLAGTSPGYSAQQRRGGVMRLEEHGDSPEWQPWASGLRNPVGLAWQTSPDAGSRLLATNNGPDHWGYDEPRELLVNASQGSFHGMPWYQWVDDQWQADECISGSAPLSSDDISTPLASIPARSAPMGLAVVPEGHPLVDLMDIVVAVHGSWGTAPAGKAWGDPASRRAPQLIGVKLSTPQTPARLVPLLNGLQNESDGERWIRPLDVAFGPDGSLYMTSDTGASGLYRLAFDSF